MVQSKNKNQMRKQPQTQKKKMVAAKKKGGRQLQGYTAGRFGIPTRYPTPVGDVVPVTFKASSTLAADASGFTSAAIIYGKGSSSSTYIFLDDLIPGFGALCNVYSRFLIRRARIEVRTVTATLNGGYVGVNYEPTDSNRAGPPANLLDVSASVNYAMATAGAPGVVLVSPTDYFNDWKQCVNDSATNDPYSTQMGVTQIIGGGFTASTASALMYEIEIEAYFCGYRS